jgi:fibronectin type 3 domain-containing protein
MGVKTFVALLTVFAAGVFAQTIPHGVNLSWSWTGTGTPTYSVYRATVSGAEAKPALATGITPLTYTDSTAVVGTKYYYTVTATVGGVESTPSTEVSAQITVPSTPQNPSTTVF